jgi:hypothetical protein
VYASSHAPAVVVSTIATVAEPHASEAVNVAASGMASHSTVASAGNGDWSNEGFTESVTVMSKSTVSEFPQPSVTVKVTVAMPVAPHKSLNDV